MDMMGFKCSVGSGYTHISVLVSVVIDTHDTWTLQKYVSK